MAKIVVETQPQTGISLDNVTATPVDGDIKVQGTVLTWDLPKSRVAGFTTFSRTGGQVFVTLRLSVDGINYSTVLTQTTGGRFGLDDFGPFISARLDLEVIGTDPATVYGAIAVT